jgi:heme exporter protein D
MANLLTAVTFVGICLVLFSLASLACQRELLRDEKDERPRHKKAA